MTADETSKLIDAAGGNTKFAELLNIADDKWHQQRIANWKARGLPPAVVLEHQDKLRKLQQLIARTNRSN